MIKRTLLLSFLISLLFSTSTFANNNELIKEFSKFDRAYIPVLALTSQEKVKPSKVTMNRLNNVWSKFKSKQQNNKTNDWKQLSREIDNVLTKTTAMINSGKDLLGAHELLEEIRYSLLKYRKSNNIEYIMDAYTNFHHTMEDIVLTAKNKKPDTITNTDLNTITKNLPALKEQWDTLESFSFNKNLFGFTASKMEKLKTLYKKERLAITSLDKAISTGNKSEIISKSMGIKPNLAKAFKIFGEFPE